MAVEQDSRMAASSGETDFVDRSNGHFEPAVDAESRRVGWPVRTEVEEDVDLTGVGRALRAPERSAAGGVAYYVNLEDHHFRGFPGRPRNEASESADEQGTSL